MSTRAAAVLLVLSTVLLLSGGSLSRRLLEDLDRRQPEAVLEA